MLVFIALTAVSGCATNTAANLSAQQVLERSVADMLSWKSYRYKGTSELIVATNAQLNNKSNFTTDLVRNEKGALDGHMVVDAPGYSYETYTRDGMEYTRVKDGAWEKRELPGAGPGMVSADSRRIIAAFGDLVDDIKLDGEGSGDLKLSFVMGDKYKKGAAAIVGSAEGTGNNPVPGLAMEAADWNAILMTLTLERDTLRVTGVWTKSSSPATEKTPAVSTVTEGTFTRINEPVDIEPVP